MRKLLYIVPLLILIQVSFAQFKEQTKTKPNIYDSIIKKESRNLLFGFLNPANLQMRHSFSISYMSIGGKGIMVNTYTNSLFYKFSDNLNLRADITFRNSPFNSFGRGFQSQINGIFIDRLELNYRPFRNMIINLQYRNNPFYYYDPYYYLW